MITSGRLWGHHFLIFLWGLLLGCAASRPNAENLRDESTYTEIDSLLILQLMSYLSYIEDATVFERGIDEGLQAGFRLTGNIDYPRIRILASEYTKSMEQLQDTYLAGMCDMLSGDGVIDRERYLTAQQQLQRTAAHMSMEAFETIVRGQLGRRNAESIQHWIDVNFRETLSRAVLTLKQASEALSDEQFRQNMVRACAERE